MVYREANGPDIVGNPEYFSLMVSERSGHEREGEKHSVQRDPLTEYHVYQEKPADGSKRRMTYCGSTKFRKASLLAAFLTPISSCFPECARYKNNENTIQIVQD